MRTKELALVQLAGLSIVAACTKPNPASCLDDFCDTPGLPYCDASGLFGEPKQCIGERH